MGGAPGSSSGTTSGGGATGVWEAGFGKQLINITAHIMQYALQLAAPVAISLFSVNVAFGVMSKAMPQMNVLVLSFAVTALIGMVVLFIGMPEFQGASANILTQIGDWMTDVARALRGSGR
jgi:flagellar biosynthetic protein FliR